MTAQQLHDQKLKKGIQIKPGSRKVLEGLLAEKNKSSNTMSQSQPLDEIGMEMQRHSGLTREEAERIVEMQGFV